VVLVDEDSRHGRDATSSGGAGTGRGRTHGRARTRDDPPRKEHVRAELEEDRGAHLGVGHGHTILQLGYTSRRMSACWPIPVIAAVAMAAEDACARDATFLGRLQGLFLPLAREARICGLRVGALAHTAPVVAVASVVVAAVTDVVVVVVVPNPLKNPSLLQRAQGERIRPLLLRRLQTASFHGAQRLRDGLRTRLVRQFTRQSETD
jgi:hypothetical protein